MTTRKLPDAEVVQYTTTTDASGQQSLLRIRAGNTTQTWVLDSIYDRAEIIQDRCGVQWNASEEETTQHLDLDCTSSRILRARPLAAEFVLAFGVQPEILRTRPTFWTLVPGIGAVLAKRVHDALHDPNSGVHHTDLCTLKKIRGIGPKLATRIREFMGHRTPCAPNARKRSVAFF